MYYTYNYNCLLRIIFELGKKHEAEKTKGHIGAQYAYMLEAQKLIK